MKTKKISNGKAAIRWGVIFIVLAASSFLASGLAAHFRPYSGATAIFGLLVLACLPTSIILLIVGGSRKERSKRYERYFSLVPKETDLALVADTLGYPYARAERDIRNMIGKSYLSGVTLDQTHKRLLITRQNPAVAAAAGNSPLGGTVAVICPGCGARNGIPRGGKGECAYCGSPLEGKQGAGG